MSIPSPSLLDRHTDATQRLILDSAVELLERAGLRELTVRAVAKRAGMSERTVFRYYASRDEFLDAVAGEIVRRLEPPAPPTTIQGLAEYPQALYSRFEERAALVKAALHTEVFERIRESIATERWTAAQKLIDAAAPHRSEHDRKVAAANVRYYLAATTWHYYRFYFNFSLPDTIDCACTAVRLALEEILKP